VVGLTWLSLIFGGSLEAQVFADSLFRQSAASGLRLVYQLQAEEALAVFTALEEDYPTHPAPYFLQALTWWWQAYITTSDESHDEIEALLRQSLAQGETLATNPELALEYTFFQYMGHAFLARLYVLREEWVAAANAGRRALPYLKAGFGYTEQAPEFYFGSGIYHYYAEVYPQAHPVVKPFTVFFPNGDAELGLHELEQAATLPNFTQTEARFYLGDIYLNQSLELTKALALKRALHQEFPRNTWFAMEYGRAFVQAEQPAAAASIFGSLIKRFEAIPSYATQQTTATQSSLTSLVMAHVYHYQARAAFEQQLAPPEVQQYLNQALQQAQLAGLAGHYLLPCSYFYLGRAYDREGLREAAIAAYQQALDLPENEAIAEEARGCLLQPCP
jgi:tetratricopeptide (TPR) repeat protein